MAGHGFRSYSTREERHAPLLPYIDPGFVNHRLVETFIGPEGMSAVNAKVSQIPSSLPTYERDLQIDHIYTRVALRVCEQLHAPSLGMLLSQEGHLAPGCVVSSTEVFQGSADVYDGPRAIAEWLPGLEFEKKVLLQFSTRHIKSDTLRSDLSGKCTLSFIAFLARREQDLFIFAPMVMGLPWLLPPPQGVLFDTMFMHYDFFEHFVEDIDEFGKAEEVGHDVDWSVMQHISEVAFKQCICGLLGDQPHGDWGGERSDHFTAHLHIGGERLTAAFLLKGPGVGFREMQPIHLGKRGDQIFRLASEPAKMLVVQHCHEIGPAVRATLRAFAVQPHHARRYCLIDGRDSFRLLAAYDLVEKALSLSK